MNSVVNRQRQEKERKKATQVEQIETNIPSPKTTSVITYRNYITYMLRNFEILGKFYHFQTVRIHWSNYIGKQRAIEQAVNILVNGSTKYNKTRRERTRRNKRKRNKTDSKYKRDPKNTKHSKKEKQRKRVYKEQFEEGDTKKMAMIIFGDGLTYKPHVKFKELRTGVIDKLYRQLKLREKLGVIAT